jgi:hypothetical protein
MPDVAARQRGLGAIELIVPHGIRHGNRGELAQHFLGRDVRGIRLHAGVAGKQPARTAHVETGSRAVRNGAALAEIAIDAAGELPAQQRIQRDERVVVGRAPRRPELPDAQLGLRGAGPMHDQQTRAGAGKWRRRQSDWCRCR